MSTYCTATVINHKEIVPGVWKMELAAPEIAKTARPGQFIQLYPPDERNLLARPISLSSISKMSVTIVYRVVGKGTKQFSCLQVDDMVRVMGPLGNGFTLLDAGTQNVIVGGGLGIFHLFWSLQKGFMEIQWYCLGIRMLHLWQRIFKD